MSSHFSSISNVIVGSWANFKIIAAQAGAGKMIYCEDVTYYSVVVHSVGLDFIHIIQRTDPVIDPSDEKDFDDNHKANALNVD